MSEPYQAKKIPEHPWPAKRPVIAKVVAVTGLRLMKRGTWLIHPRTRALRTNDIVELTITDEQTAAPGIQINSVLYIGFIEVAQGGVVVAGDPVKIGRTVIGEVAGFSDIHYPNHLNVIAEGTEKFASKYIHPNKDAAIVKLGFELEDRVVFGKVTKTTK